jgi:hypothetical protein
VTGVVRQQVLGAQPPTPPTVTGYQVIAKACPACGETAKGVAPVEATSLVQYGPVMHAKAALAACAHYLLVARAATLVAAFTGVPVFAGFMAGILGKAAGWLGPFMGRARGLRAVPARRPPGAAPTGWVTWPGCPASAPAGRCGRGPWPAC